MHNSLRADPAPLERYLDHPSLRDATRLLDVDLAEVCRITGWSRAYFDQNIQGYNHPTPRVLATVISAIALSRGRNLEQGEETLLTRDFIRGCLFGARMRTLQRLRKRLERDDSPIGRESLQKILPMAFAAMSTRETGKADPTEARYLAACKHWGVDPLAEDVEFVKDPETMTVIPNPRHVPQE